MERLDWLNEQLRREREFVVRVLEIVRLTKRTEEKTLRLQIRHAIRAAFGFREKRCGCCGGYFPPSQFPKDRRNRDELGRICFACSKLRKHFYRQRRKENTSNAKKKGGRGYKPEIDGTAY